VFEVIALVGSAACRRISATSASILSRCGVGGHLGGVQCDHAKADHAGGFAQLERSDQDVGQGLLVADAEAGRWLRGRGGLAPRTRKAMSSVKRRLIWRQERTPTQ
jgi:hypothetical protein